MKKKQLVFRPTGEVRIPQVGEWYYTNKNVFHAGNPFYDYPQSEIYSAIEEVINVPLWKPEPRAIYYYFTGKLEVRDYINSEDSVDKALYENGNGFDTKQETQDYADLTKFVLTQRLLDNPEFSAMIEKLKGELQ